MKPNSKAIAMSVLMLILSACGGGEADSPTNSQSTTQATSAPKTPTTPAQNDNTQESTLGHQDDKDTPSTNDGDKDTISENTQTATPPSADTLKLGQARYEATCKVCHEQGLLNAPKLSDKANWAKRQEKGKDTLYTHSIKGFNKMPAQAVNGVSEDEVKAAVDFMLTKTQ